MVVALSTAAPLPPLTILQQTDKWLVIAKPANTLVHRNKFLRRGEVPLVQRLRDQISRYVYPVHRLDGATSGCLLFALDSPTTAMLQAAMQHEDAAKTYYAFTRGDAAWKWGDAPFTVERPIKSDKGVLKNATTHFQCVGAHDHGGHDRSSLLVARPATGRWHQIRRHCNGLSHPIIGDAKHGDTKVNTYWREERGLRRLGLHCAEMDLPLPDGGRLHVECPPPADLTAVWAQLPWWDDACATLPLLGESQPEGDEYLS